MSFISNLLERLMKKDEHDKEYTEFLENELEKLKKETNEALEKEKKTSFAFQSLLESEQKQKILLQEQVKNLEENGKKQVDEAAKRISDMTEQIQDYENNYDASARVLALARKDAEQTINDAKEEAKKIKDRARVEAMIYQKRAENNAKEKYDMDFKRFELAKESLIDCLNTLNQSHSKLVEAHNELGELLKRMPIQIDTLFPGETFDFLMEKGITMEPEEVVEVEPAKKKQH